MAALTDADGQFLRRALDLAPRGLGAVEPNPMVGCVLVREGGVLGEGWHQRYGGPHAEIEALNAAQSAGHDARGATAYVTLEPCCHTGKTPPCTAALIAAGVLRVVVGCLDPNPQVAGKGVAALRAAGVDVTVAAGLLAAESADLIAPFAKRMTRGRPWIIAKWAMSLDGKIAAASGDSKWISGEESRAVVHELRGRVDGIMVGRRTAEIDDPLLTARPPGLRTPTRIVVDTQATLSPESQLVRTACEAPVLVAASSAAPKDRVERLRAAGVEVWQSPAADHAARLADLLDELGRRQMTNVLIEGGAQLLGALRDAREIDEVHVFVAPKILGGPGPGPVAGAGVADIGSAMAILRPRLEKLGEDFNVSGRIG